MEEIEEKVVERTMRKFLITQRDINFLKKLGMKRRGDCVASFSVEPNGEMTWPGRTRGWTKEEQRNYILGVCPVWEEIAKELLVERPFEGGRVLLRRDGKLVYHVTKGVDIQFAEAELVGVITSPSAPTGPAAVW